MPRGAREPSGRPAIPPREVSEYKARIVRSHAASMAGITVIRQLPRPSADPARAARAPGAPSVGRYAPRTHRQRRVQGRGRATPAGLSNPRSPSGPQAALDGPSAFSRASPPAQPSNRLPGQVAPHRGVRPQPRFHRCGAARSGFVIGEPASFPQGTFWLARYAGACCAPPTPPS
jgi:hypothetical protein